MTEVTDERVEAMAKHLMEADYSRAPGSSRPYAYIPDVYNVLAKAALEFIENEGKEPEYVMPIEFGIYRDKEGDDWYLGPDGWYFRDMHDDENWHVSEDFATNDFPSYAPFTKVV